jgi:hypothetical protein
MIPTSFWQITAMAPRARATLPTAFLVLAVAITSLARSRAVSFAVLTPRPAQKAAQEAQEAVDFSQMTGPGILHEMIGTSAEDSDEKSETSKSASGTKYRKGGFNMLS